MTARTFPLTPLLVLTALSLLVPQVRADPVEDAVSEIRKRYNRIESWSLSPKRISFESQDEQASGELVRYYHDGALAKANLSFGVGDHGASDETYYYHDGELFFVYAVQGYWRFTGRTLSNGESETVDVMIEHRLYFSDGRLVRHLRKEAQSTDAAALKGLISKEKNQPHQDPAYAAEVRRRGMKCAGVSSAAGLEKAVLGE